MQDANGWTPRTLAEHHEQEEIKNIFQNIRESRKPAVIPISKNDRIGGFQSDPSMPAISQESMPLPPTQELTWLGNHGRRSSSSFHNSIFGMISTANRYKRDRRASEISNTNIGNVNELTRVTLSCPEKGEQHARKLVLLPKSLEELLDIGARKFGISPTKILTSDGAEVDDINLIRDGDHLIIARD
ncbi:Potassium channel AKT1 [Spatholobus suberectus]|nr:Potassium channel AKT1 [Spatholobus suberectus]